MKNYNLSEIIDFMLSEEYKNKSILYEIISPYKKQLYIYFKNFYNCEPILLIDGLTNNSSYCRLIGSDGLDEEVLSYLDADYLNEEDEDLILKFETIMYNSKFLKDVI